MDLLINVLGVTGLVILLGALVFNVQKRTRARIILYYLMQLIGGGLLCIYAFLISSQIFFILQAVWVLVSAYFLYEYKFDNKNKNNLKKKKN
jgi:lipid-A-disaccharide synthase-like uncharacterized protein